MSMLNPSKTKKVVLLVDDFENTLFVTALSIESLLGFKTIKASSAKEALVQLRKEQPIDIVITDYNMPEMNGLQFVEELKKIHGCERLPIFVLSTEQNENIKKAALKAGVTAWIQKPFKTDRLVELIGRALNS